jgi:hypothetical protein
MYSPYSRAFSGALARPSRRNSPNTRMEASGVRSSCETLETNSVFICESLVARAAFRSASTRPPTSTAVMSSESDRLKPKVKWAHSSGVMRCEPTASLQSANTNGKFQLKSSPCTMLSLEPATMRPWPSRMARTRCSRTGLGRRRSAPCASMSFGRYLWRTNSSSTSRPATPTTRDDPSRTGLRITRFAGSCSSTIVRVDSTGVRSRAIKRHGAEATWIAWASAGPGGASSGRPSRP